MSKQDEHQLEKLIADVFFQAKRKSITPRTVRLESIIKRGKYETASKDLMRFSNQLLTAMIMLFSLFLKVFSTPSR